MRIRKKIVATWWRCRLIFSGVEVHILGPGDVDAFLDHRSRVTAESGDGVTPHFAVQGDSKPVRDTSGLVRAWSAEAGAADREGTAVMAGELKWRRTWGAWASGRIVGSLDLFGGGVKACAHRANISIAVESHFRRSGIGRRLVDESLRWVLEYPSVEWVDFSIFSGNSLSFEFCKQYGFREVGYVEDAYRIGGVSIGAHRMTLALREIVAKRELPRVSRDC